MTERKPRGARAGSGLSQWGISVGNTPKDPTKEKHVIDDISYSKDFIVCSCAWKGAVAEFQPHRKEEGATRPHG